MKGRKMVSLSAESSKHAEDGGKLNDESSKPAEDGGILTGENGVVAMHPQDSPVNTHAPERPEEDAEGGEREVGDKNDDHQIVRADGLAEEGETKRPRLEEGFYDLEAIRKKRIRQGEVQYLIKWRGWPESANTWEPSENLSSCPGVVAAFERRWCRARSGKQSTRGRKRKLSGTRTGTEIELHHSAAAAKVTPQTKTRGRQHASAPVAMDITHTDADDTMGVETRNMQPHSRAAAKDNVPATKKTVSVVPVPFQCLDDSSIEKHVHTDVCSPEVSGSSREQNEHPLTNGSSLDKSVADSEAQILGDCIPPGFPKSNIAQPVLSGPRAIKKTVGSPRRFKKDSPAQGTDDAPDSMRTTCGSVTAFGKDDFEGVTISEIIRVLSSQVSSHRGAIHVSVTFLAKRSDGKVVTVTNGFLKAINPHLLLRFYETNIRNIPIPTLS